LRGCSVIARAKARRHYVKKLMDLVASFLILHFCNVGMKCVEKRKEDDHV